MKMLSAGEWPNHVMYRVLHLKNTKKITDFSFVSRPILWGFFSKRPNGDY